MTEQLSRYLDSLTDDEREAASAEVMAHGSESELIAAAKRGAAKAQSKRQAQLAERYIQEMLAVRGKPHLLQAVKQRYIEAGLDVDRVDFTNRI